MDYDKKIIYQDHDEDGSFVDLMCRFSEQTANSITYANRDSQDILIQLYCVKNCVIRLSSSVFTWEAFYLYGENNLRIDLYSNNVFFATMQFAIEQIEYIFEVPQEYVEVSIN